MSINLTVNGQNFNYPENGDQNWGPDATDWSVAVTNGMLQKAGGLFQLLAEVDYGSSFGLRSLYYKSRSSNVSVTGSLRLARTDGIGWRNQANSADLLLGVSASNGLQFNGLDLISGAYIASVTDTATIDLTLSGTALSADIIAASITNAQINASAAIALSKLAATTASRVLVSDGSGLVSPSSITTATLAFLDASSSVQTQLNSKANLASPTFTGTVSGINSTMVGLGNVNNTSDATKDAASATLTNKTITGASIHTPSRSDVKQDTKANLITYASTATNGQTVFATDTKEMFQVVDSLLVAIGGVSGGLNTVFQLTADELLTDWTTGDNATFLGAGALTGTFVKNTATPLQGDASYVYTQVPGSLNDYLASPVRPVARRFRGSEVILFHPFTYDGNASDIAIIFYDVTNSAIIPSSTFVPSSVGLSILKTSAVIPLTCASIRIGYQVKVQNIGKIFAFDSIELTNSILAVPQPAQQFTEIDQTVTIGVGIVTGVSTRASGAGIYSYNSSTGVYTVVRNGVFNLAQSQFTNSASSMEIAILINGVGKAFDKSTANSGDPVCCSLERELVVGNTFSFNIVTGTTSGSRMSVSASALSDQILTVPETFSTDTAPLVFAGSAQFTLSTLTNAAVGTFITFTYTAASNTRTQTLLANPPTQTITSMNQNGILIYNRIFSAIATSGLPATFAIQIGKGLKGIAVSSYKDTGKVTSGSTDLFTLGADIQVGLAYNSYDERTGVLFIDAGHCHNQSATTTNVFAFPNTTSGTSSHLTINASKNPALTGLNVANVAARAVSSTGQSIGGTAAIVTWNASKTYDTHNALNAGTGVFTAPEPGYYRVSAGVVFSSAAYAVGNAVFVSLFRNGVLVSTGTQNRAWAAATINVGASHTDVVYLSANDTIDVRVTNERGATTLFSSTDFNFVSIIKTGN